VIVKVMYVYFKVEEVVHLKFVGNVLHYITFKFINMNQRISIM